MANQGAKLTEVTIDDIVERLRVISDGKAIKRLVAAREYLDGSPPAAIAEKYGWPEQTIYSWLNRLDADGVDDGIYDDKPPGRPSRLDDDEFKRFQLAVMHSPEKVGMDASSWSTELAKTYLHEELGHEYSSRHVRRLLKRARNNR